MAEKDKRIFIRVSEVEKAQIEQKAKQSGFDTVSAYILYLIRNSEV